LEEPKLRTIVDEEMTRHSSRPQLQLVVDAFYESLHPGCRAGKLRVSFDSYASFRTDGSVDEAVLKLIKKHYENAFNQQVFLEKKIYFGVFLFEEKEAFCHCTFNVYVPKI
jgi:hypothetical protein